MSLPNHGVVVPLSQCSPYRYAPLKYQNSVRLLTLHPGEGSSPLSITLSEVQFEQKPQFDALSYTWATQDGDATLSSSIFCSGGRISTSKNCEAALHKLRNKDSDKVLWVDAICINQSDNKERSSQVALMKSIYSNASQVFIWLGEASEKVGIFMAYLSRMAAEIRQLEDDKKDPGSSALHRNLLAAVYQKAVYGQACLLVEGFWDLYYRRWWDRVWVVQEAAFAKCPTLMCSEHTVPYSDLFTWHNALIQSLSMPEARYIWRTGGSLAVHFRILALSKLEASRDGNPLRGLMILYRARRLEASDARDKIFATLGLIEGFSAIVPSPDYAQAPTEVFTAVAKSFLAHSKSLKILNQAAAAHFVSERPSWVPDWSVKAILSCTDWNDVFYRAAGNSDANYEISSDNKELRVKGKRIDTLTKVPLCDLSLYTTNIAFKENIPGWQESCRLESSLYTYPTGETVREALWRTLCWNVLITGDGSIQQAPLDTATDFEEWRQIILSNNDLQTTEHNLYALEARFELRIYNIAPLYITAKGYLASVPWTAKAGDVIAVLTGGTMPFVLRPVGNYYRLVGHCYVHGIMNGEAFPDDQNELEWVSIR
jgi:hypothetical protein